MKATICDITKEVIPDGFEPRFNGMHVAITCEGVALDLGPTVISAIEEAILKLQNKEESDGDVIEGGEIPSFVQPTYTRTNGIAQRTQEIQSPSVIPAKKEICALAHKIQEEAKTKGERISYYLARKQAVEKLTKKDELLRETRTQIPWEPPKKYKKEDKHPVDKDERKKLALIIRERFGCTTVTAQEEANRVTRLHPSVDLDVPEELDGLLSCVSADDLRPDPDFAASKRNREYMEEVKKETADILDPGQMLQDQIEQDLSDNEEDVTD